MFTNTAVIFAMA